ncbi:MAG: hypothetical protein IJ043_10695 [Clostridia bacterium]|nr:hypothetical protein [Clostridia bacterium]
MWPGREYPKELNKIFHEIAAELPRCGAVSAEGLTLKPDGLHFDSRSCRIFGSRYFQEYLKLIKK